MERTVWSGEWPFYSCFEWSWNRANTATHHGCSRQETISINSLWLVSTDAIIRTEIYRKPCKMYCHQMRVGKCWWGTRGITLLCRIIWSRIFLKHPVRETCCTGPVVLPAELWHSAWSEWCAPGNNSGQRRNKVTIVYRRLSNSATGKHDLKVSWWRKCSGMKCLQTDSDNTTKNSWCVQSIGNSGKLTRIWNRTKTP